MNWIHAIILAAVAATVGVIANHFIEEDFIEEAWLRAALGGATVLITYYILRFFKMF
jgi:hypothetical protein